MIEDIIEKTTCGLNISDLETIKTELLAKVKAQLPGLEMKFASSEHKKWNMTWMKTSYIIIVKRNSCVCDAIFYDNQDLFKTYFVYFP